MSKNKNNIAGLWMDHHQANFITPVDGEFSMGEKITSTEYQGKKGEHTANNAERSDNRKYFKSIAPQLMQYDEIYLFGPGTSQEEFLNFLHEDQHFKHKKITLGTADQMTDPQLIARVRDFFAS